MSDDEYEKRRELAALEIAKAWSEDRISGGIKAVASMGFDAGYTAALNSEAGAAFVRGILEGEKDAPSEAAHKAIASADNAIELLQIQVTVLKAEADRLKAQLALATRLIKDFVIYHSTENDDWFEIKKNLLWNAEKLLAKLSDTDNQSIQQGVECE